MTTACSQLTDLHQVILIYCPGIHSTRKTTLQAGTCQKHGSKERFCCSYQRFGVLARRRQERLYAGGSFLLYGVPPLRSEAFVGLRSGRYGQELWGNWEKTKWSAKIQWHVFVGLQIQSSVYFMMVLTLFAHDGLWRCVLNQ